MLALVAFGVGWLRLLLHVATRILLVDTPYHHAIRDTRWRGDGSLKSLELRCRCGQIFYQYWTSDK